MHIKSILLAFTSAAFCVNAALLSVTPTSVSTAVLAVQTYSIPWPLTAKNITKYVHHSGSNETDVTFFGDHTVVKPPTAVSDIAKREGVDVISVISSFTIASFGLAGVVCVAGTAWTAGLACVSALLFAAIAVVMNVLYVSIGLGIWKPPGITKRDELLIDWEFKQDFQATEDCTVRCQIQNKVEQSTWTHVGNMTVSGTKHMLHFWQSGNLSGLRVQQLGSQNYKRDDEDIYIVTDFQQQTDLIGTFYYVEDSVASIDDWGTDDTTTAGDDAANYIVDNNVGMGCFDVGDSDGTVFQSVFIVDDSDLVEELPQDDIESVLYECYSEDPYTTSPIRKLK